MDEQSNNGIEKKGEKMKVVGLVASPHGLRGSTAKLTRIVLEGVESQGAKTEMIYLTGKNVLFCKACDACHKKGRCPQDDQFETIKDKILRSDALILASPNYIFNVSAQMKAFMDRCCGVIHCLAFEGKYGVSVVTSGGGDEKEIADYLDLFLITTGVQPVGSVWATMGKIAGDVFPEDIKKSAFELGEKLVLSWKNRVPDKDIEKRINRFKERMRSLMLWRKQEWPYEYNYWKERRGLQ